MIWLCEYMSRTLALSTIFAVSSGIQLCSPRRSSVTVFRSGRTQMSPVIISMLTNTNFCSSNKFFRGALKTKTKTSKEQRTSQIYSCNLNSLFVYLDKGNTRTSITIKYSTNTVAITVAIFGSI